MQKSSKQSKALAYLKLRLDILLYLPDKTSMKYMM